MKKSFVACVLMLLLLAAGAWAQGSAQTSSSGAATVSTPAAQPQSSPQQPPAGTPQEGDAQMTRPAPGNTPGQQPQKPGPASAADGEPTNAAGAQAATMVHAELNKTLDAKKAKVGDEVIAKTTTDFRTSSGTRVPAGTKLLGRVTEAQKHDKNADAPSKLAFVFDRAVLKDKSEMPVNVVVQAIGAAQATAAAPGADAGMDAGAMGGGQSGAGSPGLVGGAAGTVGGVAGSAGQTVGGVGSTASSVVGGATGAAGDVAGSTTGAVGASGRLTAQSQGVIGLEGLQLESSASSNTQAAVVTSDKKNVKLNSGTQLVLRVSAQ